VPAPARLRAMRQGPHLQMEEVKRIELVRFDDKDVPNHYIALDALITKGSDFARMDVVVTLHPAELPEIRRAYDVGSGNSLVPKYRLENMGWAMAGLPEPEAFRLYVPASYTDPNKTKSAMTQLVMGVYGFMLTVVPIPGGISKPLTDNLRVTLTAYDYDQPMIRYAMDVVQKLDYVREAGHKLVGAALDLQKAWEELWHFRMSLKPEVAAYLQRQANSGEAEI